MRAVASTRTGFWAGPAVAVPRPCQVRTAVLPGGLCCQAGSGPARAGSPWGPGCGSETRCVCSAFGRPLWFQSLHHEQLLRAGDQTGSRKAWAGPGVRPGLRLAGRLSGGTEALATTLPAGDTQARRLLSPGWARASPGVGVSLNTSADQPRPGLPASDTPPHAPLQGALRGFCPGGAPTRDPGTQFSQDT